MPKKPINIPVHVATGSVPHFFIDWNHVADEAEEILAEGYDAWVESTKDGGKNQGLNYRLNNGAVSKVFPCGRNLSFHNEIPDEQRWKDKLEGLISKYRVKNLPNWEFEDTLEVISHSRGRSAANFDVKSATTGATYTMFMTDMVDVLQNCDISKGKITAKWTFCKRGSNYGIRMVS